MANKRVLVINTVRTGMTGITSVMMNYTLLTHLNVDYDFVLVGKSEPVVKAQIEKIAKNVFIPPISRTKKPLMYCKWLKKLMLLYKYDAVHVHANSATAYFDIHAAKKAKIPIRICHSHSSSCKHKFAHKILRPFLNNELTVAVACSDLAGKWLFSGKYLLLYNGIDIQKYKFSASVRQQYREILNLGNKFVIGHVGYLEPLKNHMFLLEAFKNLLNQVPDAKMLLVGEGKLRSQIEDYIKVNNMQENVQLLGNRTDVASIYQCMDVFVLPSLWEGLPVTLVEAQAAGLPCIVSSTVSRQADLTGNVTYIGIEQDNIMQWVEAFNLVYIDNMARYEKAQIVEKSKFNIHNCADAVLKLYKGEIQ